MKNIKNQDRKLEKPREKSAGFIVLKPDGDGDWRVLILRAAIYSKEGKLTGQVSKAWDIPKGHVEGRESDLDAATRETKEETQFDIVPAMMAWGPQSFTVEQAKKDVSVFLCEWNADQDPVFLPGKMGFPEHSDFLWASWSLAYTNVYGAMKKGIVWSYSVTHDCSEQEALDKIIQGA